MSSAGDVLPYAAIVLANISLPYDSISGEESLENTRDGGNCATLLGTSKDGATYYLNDKAKMTWYQAKDLCHSCGLKLATIRTREMSDFLHQKLKDKEKVPAVWIAARESRNNYKYLSWDLDGEDIEAEAFDYFVNPLQNIKNYVCAVYEAKQANYLYSWLVLRPCDDRKHMLCMKR